MRDNVLGTSPPPSKKCGLLSGVRIIGGSPITAASIREYGAVARAAIQVSEIGGSPRLAL